MCVHTDTDTHTHFIVYLSKLQGPFWKNILQKQAWFQRYLLREFFSKVGGGSRGNPGLGWHGLSLGEDIPFTFLWPEEQNFMPLGSTMHGHS